MSQYLTLREVQLEELEILKSVTKFLDEKKLEYFLCAGTLLGAIRHKGFIPWDDDIDIFMPRDQYQKFIEIARKEKINSKLEVLNFKLNNSRIPFIKVVNKEITIDSNSLEDKNLWIDIFPIDGLPYDYKKFVSHVKKLKFYKGIFYLHNTTIKKILNERKSIFNKFLKIILKPISNLISLKFVSKRLDSLASKYDYQTSKFVGVSIWVDGYNGRYEKNLVLKNSVIAEFEDRKFKIPSGYDIYLRKIYGDYMQIPSVDKQTTHSIKAQKLKR